jgi:hypothetical protein
MVFGKRQYSGIRFLAFDEPLDKGHGLKPGDVKAFAAADVLAGHQIVFANHIRLGLGEAGAIAVVGVARQGGLLAADEPGDLVFLGLAAVGTSQRVRTLLGFFVEKVAFFHNRLPQSFALQRLLRYYWRRKSIIGEYGIQPVVDWGFTMAKKKAAKKFSVTKAVKANARERVGQPKAERVIIQKPRPESRKAKHKVTLVEKLDADPEW